MSRHAQRAEPRAMTCPSCKRGSCRTCVDVDRGHVGLAGALCTCRRSDHPAVVAAAVSGPHSAALEPYPEGAVLPEPTPEPVCPRCGLAGCLVVW